MTTNTINLEQFYGKKEIEKLNLEDHFDLKDDKNGLKRKVLLNYYMFSAFKIACRHILDETNDEKYFFIKEDFKKDSTKFDNFMNQLFIKNNGDNNLTYNQYLQNESNTFWENNNGKFISYKVLPYLNYQSLVDFAIEKLNNIFSKDNELDYDMLFTLVKFNDKVENNDEELEILESFKTEERKRKDVYGCKELYNQWNEKKDSLLKGWNAPEIENIKYMKKTIKRKIENDKTVYDVKEKLSLYGIDL